MDELLREPALDPVSHLLRNLLVESLRNAARDAGQRVRISAEGDCLPDGVLEVRRIQESDDRRRNGALAAVLPVVDGMPVLPGLMQVIPVRLLDVCTDLFRL